MSEIALNSLVSTAREIQNGALSPVDLTQQMLKRIEVLDSIHHSYVVVFADEALAQAKRAETGIRSGAYLGPLHGIPVAVKDLCYTPGTPTTCGAQMMADWIPDAEATVVTKLREAGAIILGKLHMTEFALRWHHPYRPIPVNPWGENLWPGVSSSGSGVATSAGLCFGALGTDTGGSIRFPASSCNIVGLKPTYGRVSRFGVFPLGESLDHIGPLTRTVADAAAMLGAIAGFDSNDPTSSRRPVPDFLAATQEGINGLRIGVDREFITAEVQPDVSAAVLAAIDSLVNLGAKVVEVKAPSVDGMTEAWYTITAAEAVAGHEGLYPERADEYGPFRELLDNGAKMSAADYAKAQVIRDRVAGELLPIFDQCDAFVCPFMPTPTPLLNEAGDAVFEEGYNRSRFSYPFNFSRNPSLVLPCGMSQDDRPISLQLVGKHFDEETLCRLGHAFEQATDWHKMRPPMLH